VAIIARQFSRPRGPLGRLIGHGMARAKRRLQPLGRAADRRAVSRQPRADRRARSRAGHRLEAALAQFRQARGWGIDLSPEMLSQSRKRNLAEVRAGRLTLTEGSAASLAAITPIDVVVANHVLYFWHQPADELARIHAALRPAGLLALGYQLKQNMPPMAQRHFPPQGHLLYSSDEQVAQLLAGRRLHSHQSPRQGPARLPARASRAGHVLTTGANVFLSRAGVLHTHGD
jgi:SAM-dependent methyltransferase